MSSLSYYIFMICIELSQEVGWNKSNSNKLNCNPILYAALSLFLLSLINGWLVSDMIETA